MHLRHERDSDGIEDQRSEGNKSRQGSAEAAAAGQEAGEEGADVEEQGDEVEDPAEPPHEVVVVRVQPVRHTRSIVGPGGAEGHRSVGLAAVGVVRAAHVEIGPLGQGAGAADARGVGLEEVGLVQGRGILDTGQDDEEDHDNRPGEEDEGRKPQGRI